MIPLVDLKAQYDTISGEIRREIDRVIQKGDFILGDSVAKFEEDFAKFCGAGYCVGVGSGTEALHLALRVLSVGEGDEVITVANTFVATAFAVSYAGAKPVLVDCDPKTFNMDLNQVEAKITPRTRAIIPVHLYGRALDMERLMTIATHHSLAVIEDACQAHGAVSGASRVGSLGALGCFSFYPGKNLGAYGDGGAIVTSRRDLYEKLKLMRNFGSPQKYFHDFIGYNSRLDTLQAAILSVKLKYLEQWNRARYKNAAFYHERLGGIEALILPELSAADKHVYHLYVVRTKRRDDLLNYLKANGVQAGIHYPIPLYALKAYSQLGYVRGDFPVTERFSAEILSLPMFPELTERQIDGICSLIKMFFKEKR